MGSEPSAEFCQKFWGAKVSKRDYFPLPAPQFAIKRSVTDGLDDMFCFNLFAGLQIRDGARHAQYSVMGTGR